MNNLIKGTLAYVVVTFPVAMIWHMVLFKQVYLDLALYSNSEEPVVALGLLSMVIQGVILAWLFPKTSFADGTMKGALHYAWLMGLFFASGSVIAEVAKHTVTSYSTWFLVAGSFALVHFTLVGIAFGMLYKNK
ncbi:hypothetical protein KTR10_01185 [Candidatus Kaiserbacteria bacterium]|nr:hypothetical protein [Candidatus Kaiserbacteria bacterium]